MKNKYTRLFCLLLLSLFATQTLSAQNAPVIQWQKTINIPYSNTAIQSERAYVAKASGDGYAVTTIHNRLLRLSSQGNTVWEVEIPSSSPDMPNFRQVTQIAGLVAMDDGGFVVLTADTQYWSLARFSASGQVMWVKPFGDATPASGGNVSYFYKTALIRSADGGFVVGGYVSSPRGLTSGQVYLFDAAGNRKAQKDINYYDPSADSRSVTIIRQMVPAFGGGYVAVGYVASSSVSQPQGWAARIDNELNVIWQNTYTLVGPLDDIIQASDGQNYLVTGVTDAVIPSYAGIRAIDGAGQLLRVQRSDTRSGDTYQFSSPASISSLPNSSPTQSVLFTTSSDNNRSSEFRLTTPNLGLSLGGTGREVASRFITTEDGGFLLVGTTTSADGDVQGKVGTTPATWIVKINPSSSSLVVTQPTYNCSTGVITFNTTGGDGSTITYSAPGISRASATSNTGTVEQGLRNDPKTILITAMQSGQMATYSFDFKSFCGTTPALVAPPLLSPIPDQTRIVGKQLTSDTISVSRFFGGVGSYPNFRPVILFFATGLPPGMTMLNNSNENTTSAYIGGTPTTPGVYVVTISAFISNSTSGSVPTTTTKFQITILDNSTSTPPPTGGTLTLTQPTYNCLTGAITFNTTGGDGSTVTYTAPGITRSSAISNTGTVEQGLRNDPKTILITAMQSGYSTSYSFDFKSFCSGNPSTPSSTLKLLTPIVDCSLRQVTLVTSGGDGSTITFNTPTITRSSVTSPVGIVDYCVGAKPPVLQATQSGYTATYESFDFAKQCPALLSKKPLIASKIPDFNVALGRTSDIVGIPLATYFTNPSNPINRYVPSYSFKLSGAPAGSYIDDQSAVVHTFAPFAFLYLNAFASGVYSITVTGKNECEPAATSTFTLTVNPASGTSPLTLVAPTYNCSTGAFTFNYTGGNGSAVEFQAAGITGWTTNPNQFVDKDSRTANDVKPFTLMARQNGQVVTYTWDLKAACGRSARVAAAEAGQGLQLTVKGNPVGNTAIVDISGVDGQAVQLDLLNASGHVLEQRHIEQAGVVEEQRFDLQRQPSGMLLLRAQSGQQRQTVKLIKQ